MLQMSLSEDQRYFMSILRETGFIRLDQVLPLLRINEPQKEPGHAGAMLRRLQYLGLLTKAGEDVICLPRLRNEPPNRERLLALDVLLALKPAQLLQVSVQPPYPLRPGTGSVLPRLRNRALDRPPGGWTKCS